ncbi:Cysteinyl-tRNA synthetase [hydrothermal vent metagenome]|uniref:Cysteine--tRNA ligase n=1 Tax=hydrothermal vent metagenome TaxID=652676 RepID=A0A3B1C746_9ZZZZ
MTLRIYNTLTRQKEEFKPLDPPKVGMYVCGVTVYDLCHIGHARAAIVFDIIYRYLKFSGYDVTYIRNVTDIDDKIIGRANELGQKASDVARRYTTELHKDMSALGLMKPDMEPKATEHISEMIGMVETLIANGKAYELDGSVYFSVKDFPEYGKLSGKNLDDLQAGARVEVDESKRNPMDFALWKAAKPEEPKWVSPWGEGRPGWHIECSAMGRRYLGVSFDIHGGGKDLVFPHHENEIAQSQGTSGVAPVNYWIHNGFVTIREEKMSKSLGNFFTIRDLLKIHNAEAVKLFLISSHYRSPIDFADQYLVDAYRNLARFYDALKFAEELDTGEGASLQPEENVRKKFTEEMDDDFNTATAVALLTGELRRINQLRAGMARMKKRSDDYKKAKELFLKGARGIKEFGAVLGLFGQSPAEFIESARRKKLEELELSPEELDSMIEARLKAREKKDFITADRIRDELGDKGISLHDTEAGVTWSVRFD